MPRKTSAIRLAIRPQDQRHERQIQKAVRAKRIAIKSARKRTTV